MNLQSEISTYTTEDIAKAISSEITQIEKMCRATQNPKAYILGGQSGSGKTTLQDMIIEREPNTVSINGDAYRKYHPNFEKIQEIYGNNSVNHTQSFANAVANTLIEKLSFEGYNLVIEGTCRRDDVPLKTCKDLKEKGYEVELYVMCTDVKVAWLSTIDRYNEMLNRGEIPRAVPVLKYNETVRELPENVEKLYQSGEFKDIHLYNRKKKCLYKMSDTPNVSPKKTLAYALYSNAPKDDVDRYINGSRFPKTNDYNGTQKYRLITEKDGYVMGEIYIGIGELRFFYATWERDRYKEGVNFGHYCQTYEEACEDLKNRINLKKSYKGELTMKDVYYDIQKEIDKSIIETRKDNFHYNTKEALNKMLEHRTIEEISVATALAVNLNDGRFTREVKEWSVKFLSERNLLNKKCQSCSTHQTVLNGFAEKVIDLNKSLENVLENSRDEEICKSR